MGRGRGCVDTTEWPPKTRAVLPEASLPGRTPAGDRLRAGHAEAEVRDREGGVHVGDLPRQPVGAVLAELLGARRALPGRTVVNFNELRRTAMILTIFSATSSNEYVKPLLDADCDDFDNFLRYRL